jgi:hypothetical protein
MRTHTNKELLLRVLRTPNLIRQVVEKPNRFGPGMK